MREDFNLRNSGEVLCIASLLGLMLLSGCGQKSKPAAETGADQEIYIYSDTQAGTSAGHETAPAANGIRAIIQDQSFDVELDGWGKVRFVSCEPEDVSALIEKFMDESSGSTKATGQPAEESSSETNVVSGEIIRQAAGSWTLNGPKTEAELKQYGSLQEMFGTGLHMGNGLEISDTGEISYYIGIGIGGKGQCTEPGGSTESGGSITAYITPYEDHGDSQNSLTLHLISEDDKEYLTMEYDGEILYWSR